MEEKEIYDCIVIGGGISGLSCARKLKEGGKRVLVLEARDRLGGRTQTVKFGNEEYDIGGQWIGPTQDRVKKLVKELKVKTYLQHDSGKNVIVDTNTRFLYSGTIPLYPSYIPFVPSVLTLVDLDRSLKSLDYLSAQISVDSPWSHSKAKEWDSMTVQEWLNKNVYTSGSRDAIHAVSTVMAADPMECSFLNSGGSFMRLVDSRGGAQEEKLIGGVQQLSEGLAKIIGMEHVKMKSPVRKIIQEEKGKEGICYIIADNPNDEGKTNVTYQCKEVVVAIPPMLAQQISYSPPLPASRIAFAQRLPMGSVIKTITFYKKPWWRERGYSGTLVCGNRNIDEHPVIATFDDCNTFSEDPNSNSPVDDSTGHTTLGQAAILGFIVGAAARKWSKKTEKERKEKIIKQYADQFKCPEALEPIGYIEKVWMEEEWSKGCYVGVAGPGVLTSCGEGFREPFGKIHWAGTELAKSWAGYIEGAIVSGEDVADEILQIL